MKGTVRLSDLYRRFSDQVAFLPVYIREAHPTDGWWLGGGVAGALMRRMVPQASYDLAQPKTLDERRAAALSCEQALDYGVRTWVDGVDDAVNEAWAAWPTRLYLVDRDGVVAYAGGLGPYGFKPKALGAAIGDLLASDGVAASSA